MGTGWIWKRVSEKSPDKKQYHVSQAGFPRGVFKSQSENLPEWKVEQERNRLTCKDPERNGLTLTWPKPCRRQRKSRRTEEAKRELDMGSCGKRSVLPESS